MLNRQLLQVLQVLQALEIRDPVDGLRFSPYGARTYYVRIFLLRTTSPCIISNMKLIIESVFSHPKFRYLNSLFHHTLRTTFVKLIPVSHKFKAVSTVVLTMTTTPLPFPTFEDFPRIHFANFERSVCDDAGSTCCDLITHGLLFLVV